MLYDSSLDRDITLGIISKSIYGAPHNQITCRLVFASASRFGSTSSHQMWYWKVDWVRKNIAPGRVSAAAGRAREQREG